MSLAVISRAYFPPRDLEECTSHMMRSAKRVGLSPRLFGVGEVMSTHGGSGEGPGAVDILQTLKEDYVLCCDSMDVAFLADGSEIIEKFLSMKSDFIVSGERCALRNMERTSAILNRHPGYFKEINVGLWIGKRTHAIDVLNEAIHRYRYHDETHGQDTLQTWLPLMYCSGYGPAFEIDRDCVLFQSMNMVNDVEMVGKRAHNKVTDTWPIALHFNGDKSRTTFKETVERLLQ